MEKKPRYRAYIWAKAAIKYAYEAAKSAILFVVLRVVPRGGKGPSMSAENGHPENGGEVRNEGAVATGTDRLVDLYREMVVIRAFEEACGRGFRQGKIGGYLHVYTGQERSEEHTSELQSRQYLV